MADPGTPAPRVEPPGGPAPGAGTGWLRLLRLAALDLGPLRRHRDFRLLTFAQTLSFFGAMVGDVAVAFQVYALTHSTVLVGLLGAVELAPMMVLGLAGGLFADARDRRVMVLGSELAFVLMSGVLLLNAVAGHPSVVLVFLVTAIRAGLYAIKRPSLDSLMPRLVTPDEIPAASAISSIRQTIGAIGGPAAGGVLIAVAGLPAAYGADIAGFGMSLALLALMRAVPPHPDAEAPSLRGLREGLAYAWSRPELVGTYAVDIVAMFFGMPIALFPAIAARLGGPSVLGLLYAAPSVGALVVTAASGWTGRVRRQGLAVIYAAAAWGLAIIAFGFATGPAPALVLLGLAGAADSVSAIFRSAIWNQTIPDRLRGRLAGIEFLSYTSGPALGSVESGIVAGLFGVQASIVSGGVLCVAGVAVMAGLLPRFRRYRREPGTAPVPG
jgi:MFS family permease